MLAGEAVPKALWVGDDETSGREDTAAPPTLLGSLGSQATGGIRLQGPGAGSLQQTGQGKYEGQC